jgi:uncharacterized lipoprotein YmbA
MRLGELGRGGRWILVASAFGLAGCGSGAPTAPKVELSEQEKQQIQELNAQRQREWGGAPGAEVPAN